MLHVAVASLYLSSGLLVPWYAVALLFAIWIVLLVLAIRHRQRPAWVLATPFIAAAIWLVVVQGGSWIFGWTA